MQPHHKTKLEVSRLKTKAHKLAQRISAASFSCNEAYMLYRSYYLPSISYSFPAGIMTFKESEKVQGQVIQALINGMGYNRHTPRAIIFGPYEFGGVGLSHLFSEQGSIKTMSIIQQIRQNRPLGKVLRIQFQWAQRVAGTELPILEDDRDLPQLHEEPWINTLHDFL